MGCDINARDALNRTPLHFALANNRSETAVELIGLGADVNAASQAGWTPLMSATMRNYDYIVADILARGGNIGAVTLGRQTAMFVAAAFGASNSVRILARHGGDVSPQTDVLGYTPLIFASGNCDATTVGSLLDGGACANHETADHVTALRFAEQRGRAENVDLLKKYGATV
jgi:ankyrin repeat protein